MSRLSPTQLALIKERVNAQIDRAFAPSKTKASTLFYRHGVQILRRAKERKRWLRETGLAGFYNRLDTPEMWACVKMYRASAQRARRAERGA